MVAPIADLFDDFNSGTIDTTKWTVLSGSWSAANGTMCSATSAGGFTDLRSTANWSLRQSSAFIELTNLAGGAGASYVELKFRIRNSADPTDYVEFLVAPVGGTIQMQWVENGVQQVTSTIAFNATTMRWLRIREIGGTVYFETAPDGATWTTRFSSVTQTWVSSTQAYFSTFQTGGAAGTVCFDNFNRAPESARAVAVGSEFTVSADGKLGIQRCGQPDSPWPFACSISAFNALRKSTDPCGLWVQPPLRQDLQIQGEIVSVTKGDEITIITLNLTNPDTCRSMLYYIPVTARMRITSVKSDTTAVEAWTLGLMVTGVDNADTGFQPLQADDVGAGYFSVNYVWAGAADYFWTAAPSATTTIEVHIKAFGENKNTITQFQAKLGVIGMSVMLP